VELAGTVYGETVYGKFYFGDAPAGNLIEVYLVDKT
jgi:hypothetical protein